MRRNDVVMAILASASGATLSPAQLQKAAFLLDRNAPDLFDENESFHFEPYDYGPFDKAVYDEAGALSASGLAHIDRTPFGGWKVYSASGQGIEAGRRLLEAMPEDKRSYVERVVEWVRQQSFASLVKSIYAAYPEMKAKSIFQD
jgi:hypothetical protein